MFPYLVSAEQHALREMGKVSRGALDVDGESQLSVSLERREILHVVTPNNLALVAVQTKQLQNAINMSSLIDVDMNVVVYKSTQIIVSSQIILTCYLMCQVSLRLQTSKDF